FICLPTREIENTISRRNMAHRLHRSSARPSQSAERALRAQPLLLRLMLRTILPLSAPGHHKRSSRQEKVGIGYDTKAAAQVCAEGGEQPKKETASTIFAATFENTEGATTGLGAGREYGHEEDADAADEEDEGNEEIEEREGNEEN
ncbi:hypothetical protein E4U43_003175, partial [Claviceps pusilla]